MQKEFLEQKLKEINSCIKEQYPDQHHIGVLDGLSGISLFQFYYAHYTKTDAPEEIGIDILEKSITKIDNGFNLPSYCSGIAGAVWVFEHLKQEEFLVINTDNLFSELDQYLYENMVSNLRMGNYDLLYGAIGYALYFITRFRNTKSNSLKNRYKTFLLEFISMLEEISEKDENDQYRWISELDPEKQKKGYNLGLSHGIASIIGILTKLYHFDEFKKESKTMLEGSIAYLLNCQYEHKTTSSIFPNWMLESDIPNDRSRLAWCYGDLGIGIQLWFAAKELNDPNLKEEAISILRHATTRTDYKENGVKDASICHGAFGNAQIFYRIYKETKDPIFKDALDFWIQEGLKMAVHKNGYAGYKQWKGAKNNWVSEISLLEGIAGIGLVIINYLADFDTNWDECLLIQ